MENAKVGEEFVIYTRQSAKASLIMCHLGRDPKKVRV